MLRSKPLLLSNPFPGYPWLNGGWHLLGQAHRRGLLPTVHRLDAAFRSRAVILQLAHYEHIGQKRKSLGHPQGIGSVVAGSVCTFFASYIRAG